MIRRHLDDPGVERSSVSDCHEKMFKYFHLEQAPYPIQALGFKGLRHNDQITCSGSPTQVDGLSSRVTGVNFLVLVPERPYKFKAWNNLYGKRDWSRQSMTTRTFKP